MAQYKSESAKISHDIDTVFSKLSDPEALGKMVDMLPAEVQEKMKDVEFTPEGISFSYNGMGPFQLFVTEKTAPNRIVYGAKSSPVPFGLSVDLTATDDGNTEGVVTADLEIPVFLKAMVSGPLTKGMEKVATLLAMIPYDKI